MSSWRCNQQSSDYSLCENAKLTFDANAIALLFAERILDHPEMIEQLIETEKKERHILLQNSQSMDTRQETAVEILFS